MTERLQKVIARAGLASRRAAEEMIRAGRVSIDGRPARLGDKVDPSIARVEVDGVRLPTSEDLVYYLLNKPPGVVSTAVDPHGRRTVVELVPSQARVYPVGRLDADSEGLLLLTNDGELANLLTHPRHQVPKTYLVMVEGSPSKRDVARLEEGVELDDGPARAIRARLVAGEGGRAQVEVVMGEGRKREVRRMLDALGFPVLRLVRTAIGPLRDRSLPPGQWRELTIEEVRTLHRAASEGPR